MQCNLLAIGAQFHAAVMPHAAGVPILYVQGDKPAPVTAWPARKSTEVGGQDGFLSRVDYYEWTIVASELGLTPRSGDRLIDTRNGATLDYEAAPVGSMPVWDWMDLSGLMLLVRTKRLAHPS